MAGRRKVFEDAMRKAHSYAFDRKWEKAVEEYKKALEEFPQEQKALVFLGLAYVETAQFAKALPLYEQAVRLAPEDHAVRTHLAVVYERVGRLSEASKNYMEAGDLYARQGQLEQAIECWQNAARTEPDQLEPHKKLVDAYLKQQRRGEAVEEYLDMADVYERRGQTEKAVQQCREALSLAPNSPEARDKLVALRAGRESPGATPTAAPAEEKEEGEGSPMHTARQLALAELAAMLFEDTATRASGRKMTTTGKAEIDTLIGQAIDFQSRGANDQAIASYRKLLELGMDRPAILFNLGLLYQERGLFDMAVQVLGRTLQDQNYALAANFALGECYRSRGRIDEALERFIEVLKILDLRNASDSEANDLLQLYQSLGDNLRARGDREKASAFINALVEFLSGADWEERVSEARRRIAALSKDDGFTLSLADILEISAAESILESLSLSQEYLKRNMLLTAAEECFRAIEIAPTYLPLHLRLADIFLRQDRTEEAITKYLTVADVYQIRGDISRSSVVYQRVLRLAPMDIAVRSRLIELHLRTGEADQALEQYMSLADTYYQLAQVDKALEKYNEALRLTPKSSSEKHWRTTILDRIGDIYRQRVDWRQATRAYEGILAVESDNEKAWLTLIDLYGKQGEIKKVVAALDQLTELYKSQGKYRKMLSVLEEAVKTHPREMALRERMGRAYAEQGMRKQAIAELDALGELQLDAGMHQQAAQTIQIILRLGPDNPQAYQQLLAQISRG
jgi:tetratricopeptide (TPR) repeat protein